jgi:hypothetical protein
LITQTPGPPPTEVGDDPGEDAGAYAGSTAT